MEAMVLAAGLGTRLGSITDEVPKALVPVGDKPLLAWVIDALVAAGVTRIVINTHHHENQIRAFIVELKIPGVSFAISSEPDGPYETGGGLIAAAPLFQEKQPFLLHNADVLSRIPLEELVAGHLEARWARGTKSAGEAASAGGTASAGGAASAGKTASAGKDRLIASLAVQDRNSRRALLFDDTGLLGWDNRGGEGTEASRRQVRKPLGPVRRMAFTGIHVIDPAIFELTDRRGIFSIITLYLELAEAGWVIQPVDVTGEDWFDVGTPERLEEARKRFTY